MPRDSPPNFQGLRDDLPLEVYRRNLPHWRQNGATYFVTFRLNDSLPANQIRQIKRLRESWLLHNPPPHSDQQLEELTKLVTAKQERFLDAGYGSCILAQKENQNVVQNALRFFDQKSDHPRYELGSYVIMPNHVHLIVQPTSPQENPLEKILQSWKRHVTREINKARNARGSIWEEESFDRIIRDINHLERCIHYIERNPTKANLNPKECPRWLRREWQILSSEFSQE